MVDSKECKVRPPRPEPARLPAPGRGDHGLLKPYLHTGREDADLSNDPTPWPGKIWQNGYDADDFKT